MVRSFVNARQPEDLDADCRRPIDQDADVRRRLSFDVDLMAGESDDRCLCQKGSHAGCCGKSSPERLPSLALSAVVDNTVSVCTCRQTHDKPFCDGSHKLEV